MPTLYTTRMVLRSANDDVREQKGNRMSDDLKSYIVEVLEMKDMAQVMTYLTNIVPEHYRTEVVGEWAAHQNRILEDLQAKRAAL